MSLTPYLHLDVALSGARIGDRLPLNRDDRHHLGTVLRLGPGAAVEIADGQGTSASATLADGEVELVRNPVVRPEPRPWLVLAQALPKGRKLDEIVRHACELGVDELRVIDTTRAVARLDERRAARARERWNAVVRAACEQARRPRRPAVSGPIGLDRLGRDDELLLLAHPDAPALPSVASVWQPAARLVLAVGPEGGFTDAEVADAVARGALAVGLGPSVLRAEHAGAAGLAVLAAATGRWGT
ncbi:MAG: RsmE family RNA methyltransferase [Nitriliruptoraceae bacterium]